MVICFIETKDKIGDYHTNPYYFRRSWEVKVPSAFQNVPFPLSKTHEELERRLEHRLAMIEKQFAQFTNALQNQSENQPLSRSKGKGRGKNKKSTENVSLQEQINQEASKRLREFVQSSFGCNTSESGSLPLPSAPPMPSTSSSHSNEFFTVDDEVFEPPTETTKTVFIKKVECQINSSPLDQLNEEQTKDECLGAYWRMFNSNGLANSLFTNGISYEDFKKVKTFIMYQYMLVSQITNLNMLINLISRNIHTKGLIERIKLNLFRKILSLISFKSILINI